MKTFSVVVRLLQNAFLPLVVLAVSFFCAPEMQATEEISFFSLMAQILATLLIAFAVLPRFKDAPAIHWTTLVWVGLGEGFAIFGAVPGWSGLLWQSAFAIVLSSAAVGIFAIVASVGPANEKSQRAENVKQLAADAKRLDP